MKTKTKSKSEPVAHNFNEKEKALLLELLNLATSGWWTGNPELVPKPIKSIKEAEKIAGDLYARINSH